jgi:anti-sigma B factor antagonist
MDNGVGMNLASALDGGTLIITVQSDRIDAAVAIAFKEEMRGLVEAGPARVILDLSQVAFLDSSGLGAVVAVKKLLGAERALELSGLTGSVEKVFRLTRMDSVFTIHARLPSGLRDAV